MSRSRRRNKGRSGLAWPLLAFGAVLLVVAVVLFATSRAGTAEPAPSAVATTSGSSGSPQIAVEPASIDYGYVKFGNNETFKFKVTNTGTGNLEFTEAPYIEVLEGC